MSNFFLPPSFSVFPVNGKKPLVEWTPFQERIATNAEKEAWKTRFPKSGTGIACGPVSKLFVLDVDGEAGRKSLEGKPLPKTPSVLTTREDGGQHLYFQWTPELEGRVTTKADVAPGLDVRGAGGFVVFYGWQLPPSVVPFAKPPKWLIELLPVKAGYRPLDEGHKAPEAPKAPENAPQAPRSWLAEKFAGMKEGNRNQTFTAIAGSLRARDYKPNDIFDLLLPKAKELGFPEEELRTLCESVGRYEPRIKTVEQDSDDLEVFMQDRKPVEWLCDQVFAKGSIGFFAGLPKTQKSWLLLDFALEAARGGKWLDKFPIKKSTVVFMDQERPKAEGQRRIAAMLKAKGMSIKDVKENFFFRRSSIKLDHQTSFDAFRKYLSERKPDIVIIDSFATAHTKEESNRMEIQSVLEKVKELREEFGCAFVFVHHNTKYSRQMRREGEPPSILDMSGNVAIPAAADHVFGIEPQTLASSFVYHLANNLGEMLPTLSTRIVDLDPEKSAIKIECH